MLKIILAHLISVTMSGVAFGYSCTIKDLPLALKSSFAVFTGIIVSNDGKVAKVKIEKIYKGEKKEFYEVTHNNPINKAHRDLNLLKVGKTYLISARENKESKEILDLGLCGFRGLLAEDRIKKAIVWLESPEGVKAMSESSSSK